jgi:hypothetical protein
MSDSSSSSSGGVGFIGLLTIVFIVLKLTEVVTWSWWWVLSPIWIVGLAIVGLIAVAFVIHLITT